MYKKLLLTGILFSFFSSLSFAQDEQVTVIGSLIKGTPIDSGSPISTFDAEEIAAQGNLNIVELIKMVPGSSGMDGEANQFGSNGAEGVANVNLRGLGTNRTLVLINGKRQVPISSRNGAGRSVNLHDLPMAALSRIEILKEGAAATYGSDAIAGVVNFITDSDFEGLRVNIGAKDIPNAQGEANEFSITYGTELNDGTNFLLSLGSQFKPEYYSRNSDYTKYPASANPYGGWSSIGNPGTFIVPTDDGNASTGSATTGDDPTLSLGDPGCNRSGGYHDTSKTQELTFTNSTTDAQVGAAIDLNGYAGLCRYNYAYFDNVQEEQSNSQLWMEFNGEINNQNFHVEFAYGKTDVPQYATSPAYPPNDPNSTFVPNIHPGLQKLYSQNPAFKTLLAKTELGGDGTDPAATHLMRTRVIASAGNPTTANPNGAETAFRKYDTYRFGFTFDGELTNGIDYSTSFNYSSTENTSTASDTQAHKYTAALFGYGGPNCGYEVTAMGTAASGYAPTLTKDGTSVVASLTDATRPAGCSFLNVFSNAFEQASQPYWNRTNANGDNQIGTTLGGLVGKNPLYDATLANSNELLQWMIDEGQTSTESSLLTLDFIMQGVMGSLSGGDAAWALGYERREYNLEGKLDAVPGRNSFNENKDIFDGDKYPCLLPSQNRDAAQRANCLATSPVGQFMFLAPSYGRDQSQEIDSLFAEFALPITDEFDMQLALRYEDYGTVDSVDPKVVMRWSPSDLITLRFTGQTTFRAPHPDETWDKRYTQLSFTNQTGAFKAVDITGNPNLDPEEATTYNFGVITDFGTDTWTATVDYYNFEFKNPIIFENHQQLANAYAGDDAAAKAAVQAQIYGPGNVNDGTFSAASIGRIKSFFVNGPQTETDGVDIFVKWEDAYANGIMSAGVEAAYVIDYSVSAYSKGGAVVAGAYECAGYFNLENTCRSMPDLKAKAFLNYSTDEHNFYGAINYISSYQDRRATRNIFKGARNVEIAPHTTVDATYTYSWDDFDMSFSVYNLTDELPPFAFWEMSYDPNTHSPLGRFIKVGFTYNMQ
jgi:outer membrane receptor protein involved in Fe transport